MSPSDCGFLSRRQLLAHGSCGFGALALADLLRLEALANPDATTRPDFRPKARSVIFCYMSGGVSHVDSFDPKPRLAREHDQPMPLPVQRTQFNDNGKIMASPWKFQRYGECGLEVSDLFPQIGRQADELAVVRSMTTNFSEHAQSNFFMHTGFPFLGHPSAGAWISYGLGSANENLPSYVVLHSGDSNVPHGGVSLYSNGFLASTHQATQIRADSDPPVRNIRPAEAPSLQRQRVDLISRLDHQFLGNVGADLQSAQDIESAIENYETAFRMQAAVPELIDLRDETSATRKLYGVDDSEPKKAAYAKQCLLARRLVERGVRFVELNCLAYNIGGGNAANPWDQHGDVKGGHGKMAYQVDQPIAGLISDLKRRGLLDETLVIWAGEFGRTPFSQGGSGRDHNPYGFSIFLAGGGIGGGVTYGATDEYGYHVVENRCDVYDLWATVLHLMGLDHQELTFRHGGRDFRLTDVHGSILRKILA